ncbi:MAG: amino acid adenylation domain-containing protein, partial [bacterium]|nr:amino acid adenylation domain-containing protein [bacterium]
IIKLPAGNYTWFIDMHHIITDGTSHRVLKNEFMRLYSGEEPEPLILRYRDYSEWQIKNQLVTLKQQEKFWLKQFSDEIPVLQLPTDWPRPEIQSFEGKAVIFKAGESEGKWLKNMALEVGGTLYMVILAVINIMFSRLSRQEDIVIGTPIAGRRHADLQYVVGMFVNTLAMRNYPIGDQTFKQFLTRLKEQTLTSYENQEYPFEELVDKLLIDRDTSRNPIFDVMFNLLSQSDDAGFTLEFDEANSSRYLHQLATSKFDLSITAMEWQDSIFFSFQYSIKLFKEETIQRYIGYFRRVVALILKDPHIKLWQIDVISEEEKEQLLYAFNDTDAEFPANSSLHRLFEEQSERTPHNIALVFEDRRITFESLNRRTHRLAILLRDKGVLPGAMVGVLFERSPLMILSILAVLKSGGAYVPIDPQYPAQRIKYILADSHAMILLTDNDLTGAFEFKGKVLVLDSEGGHENDSSGGEKSVGLEKVNRPEDIAYVIYTSGSTGKPRGVMTRHDSAVNLSVSQKRRFQITGSERILQFSPISFDASVEQIFIALFSGAALVLIAKKDLLDEERFESFVSRYGITHMHAVPSFLNTLRLSNSYQLKRVIAGGDICPVPLARYWAGQCDFYNEYGPTETTVTSVEIQVHSTDIQGTRLPIGKPIDNTTVYILDRWETPVIIGVSGELYIGGCGVARGYLNRVELTAEKFKRNPFDESGTYYRTGDLCRWLVDGNIEFLGRIDWQVKIRGFRIELGEIENRLLKHNHVKEAVVLAGAGANEDKYLCAYLVPDAGNIPPGSSIDIEVLRQYLSEVLPDYMIPSYFVQMEKIPLTPSGKVDRKALPEVQSSASKNYLAPRDKIEKSLVELWADVLGKDTRDISQLRSTIGVDDNFFSLGGHSLKAMVLVLNIHKKLKRKIPLTDIFKYPTIRKLGRYIGNRGKDKYTSIKPAEMREYYSLSSAQKRLYVLYRLNESGTTYNMPFALELTGEIDRARLMEAAHHLFRRHDSLRTSFVQVDDEPVQRIHEEVEFKVEYYERTARGRWILVDGEGGANPGESTGDGEENHPAYHHPQPVTAIIEDFLRPFDLASAPLLRIGLIKIEEEKHLLVGDMHHIISDGVSTSITVKEFISLYQGHKKKPLRLQYKDYSQ